MNKLLIGSVGKMRANAFVSRNENDWGYRKENQPKKEKRSSIKLRRIVDVKFVKANRRY